MKIGIIGYRNHSSKIIKLVDQTPSTKEVRVYCRKSLETDKLNKSNKFKKTKYYSSISDLEGMEAIFITSSSSSHTKYIKYFVKKKKYIFCEKPACTTNSEVKFLKLLNNNEKSKIFINFNMKESELYKTLKKNLNKQKFGKVIHFHLNATHGLAYRKDYIKKILRSKRNLFNYITGNLGIHYVNLLHDLFGDIKNIYIKNILPDKNNFINSCLIHIIFENNVDATVFLSYGTVYSKNLSVYTDKSLQEFNNKKFSIFYPRDTFSSKGLFIKPNTIYNKKFKNDFIGDSINKSVTKFIRTVKRKKMFSIREFNKNIYSVEKLINAKILN